MAQAFPKPTKPMGEAWFMAPEREMYPQLFGDITKLQDDAVTKPLEEIASGLSSFGLLAEWVEWYHYLLPQLIVRRWKTTFYQPAETLFTAFMIQHPFVGGTPPYPDFYVDALHTLGRYVMSPIFWPAGKLDAVNCLSKWTGPNGVAGWSWAGSLLSASLFFSARYLPASDVESWFQSAVSISDRLWQLQIMTWLNGAYPILTGEIDQPSDFPEFGPLGGGWDWSHAINGGSAGVPFLPPENCKAIVEVARDLKVEALIEEIWTDPTMSGIAAEAAGIPAYFLELYRT
ncbi:MULTISPECIES: hypothetical protein [unclassified Novosphingobium]|nr:MULTISPECIES: hypothetical protein [unclassified Novosphingobium]MBB3359266.1 hypothetical protein [Novosphingobium sp. BK256]MBB3450048.1 hypothetical protein [Novosphingobium sp. BK352]MBB3478527.1 hypothetical protein [Novosphingobium sp. BK369]MBB3537998.1 hypothetical protein [Novosphingobium sp. BK486]MBB3599016.1 hypothetical protein [Novosphingobium sp. BK540]NOX06572.1 hypothetical protein [Novosphingobium sp. SG754]